MRYPTTPAINPYSALLGEAFESLHPHVRRAHGAPLSAFGVMDVEHGTHWIVPLVVRLMALPKDGARQPVVLHVSARASEIEWERRIGDVTLRTRQRAMDGLLIERHGLGRIAFRVHARDGALHYEQVAAWAIGARVPMAIAPHTTADVAPTADGWHVTVTVTWRGALVCRYAGRIQPT